jgi:hypothetical protein
MKQHQQALMQQVSHAPHKHASDIVLHSQVH